MSSGPAGASRISRHLIHAIAALAVVSCMISGCNNNDIPGADNRLKKVEVIRVAPEHMKDMITLPGEVLAEKSVMLAAETSGRVEWVETHSDGSTIEGRDIARNADLLKKLAQSMFQNLLNPGVAQLGYEGPAKPLRLVGVEVQRAG